MNSCFLHHVCFCFFFNLPTHANQCEKTFKKSVIPFLECHRFRKFLKFSTEKINFKQILKSEVEIPQTLFVCSYICFSLEILVCFWKMNFCLCKLWRGSKLFFLLSKCHWWCAASIWSVESEKGNIQLFSDVLLKYQESFGSFKTIVILWSFLN